MTLSRSMSELVHCASAIHEGRRTSSEDQQKVIVNGICHGTTLREADLQRLKDILHRLLDRGLLRLPLYSSSSE